MVAKAVIIIANVAKTRIGGATLRLDTPAARMAVISPSDDMRFRVIRTPARTPSGIVNVKVKGTASANSWATVAGGAELRTRVSNSLLTRCRKRTKVNSTVPSTELVRTSRKIERLRIPMVQHLQP